MNQSLSIPNDQPEHGNPTGTGDARRALDSGDLVHRSTSHARPVGWLLALAALLLALAFLPGSPAAYADPSGNVQPAKVVNINTDDAATLALHLRGVGESRAQEIVRHRETYGPFASLDELLEVKGIGKSTLDQNRKRITLE